MAHQPLRAKLRRTPFRSRLLLGACVALLIASNADAAQAERPAGATTSPAARSSVGTSTATATATPAAAPATPPAPAVPAETTQAGNKPTKEKAPPGSTARRERSPDVFVPSEAVPEDRPLAFPVDI